MQIYTYKIFPMKDMSYKMCLYPHLPSPHFIWTVLSTKAVYFVNLFFLTKTDETRYPGGEKNNNYYKLLFILVDKCDENNGHLIWHEANLSVLSNSKHACRIFHAILSIAEFTYFSCAIWLSSPTHLQAITSVTRQSSELMRSLDTWLVTNFN